MGYPQIVVLFPMWKTAVDNSADSRGQSRQSCFRRCRKRYFHWVETPKPAAMKPKPTTMFQLSRLSMGSEPSVT